MRQLHYTTAVAVLCMVALVAQDAWAFAHLWDFSEIYTNHDGTVQFIEMRTPATGAASEQFVSGQTIRATSTVGGIAMPQKTFTFPANIPVPGGQNTNNRHLLIATSTFSTHLPSVASDFTLPADFFEPGADSVAFVFSAGPDTASLTASMLPADGLNSAVDSSIFSVTPNFVIELNSPRNFANATGSLNLPPPIETTGDYNGDSVVNAADYTVWRDTVGSDVEPGAGADGSGPDGAPDGTIDQFDFQFWKERFGNVIDEGAGGISASAPEPAGSFLVVWAWLAIWCRRARVQLL